MKTFFLPLIIVILMLGMCGCSLKESSQYDEKTNQKVSIFGINFQVPKAWEKEYEDEEYLQYGESDKKNNVKNCMSITLLEDITLDERKQEIKFGLELAKEERKIKNLQYAEIAIGGMPAEKVEYEQTIKERKYYGKVFLLQIEKNIIEISFYSISEQGIKDFEKAISSIEKES